MKEFWSKHRQTIKVLSGLLLLATFFMPVASCTRHVPVESQTELYNKQMMARLEKSENDMTASESQKKDQKVPLDIVKVRKIELYYPFKHVRINDVDTWPLLISFIWPLPVLALQFVLRNRARRLILSFVGLGLSLLSAWAVFGISIFNKLIFAGYLASLAIGCLFLVYLAEVAPTSWSFIRSRWKSFRSRKNGPASIQS